MEPPAGSCPGSELSAKPHDDAQPTTPDHESCDSQYPSPPHTPTPDSQPTTHPSHTTTNCHTISQLIPSNATKADHASLKNGDFLKMVTKGSPRLAIAAWRAGRDRLVASSFQNSHSHSERHLTLAILKSHAVLMASPSLLRSSQRLDRRFISSLGSASAVKKPITARHSVATSPGASFDDDDAGDISTKSLFSYLDMHGTYLIVRITRVNFGDLILHFPSIVRRRSKFVIIYLGIRFGMTSITRWTAGFWRVFIRFRLLIHGSMCGSLIPKSFTARGPFPPEILSIQIDADRVRVAVRVRPKNEEDFSDSEFSDCLELQPELRRLKLRKNSWNTESYKFDEVFTEVASQKRVYEAIAKPVVQSVLNGYNGTIMAYGQTGTGKTYTIGRLGKDNLSERGIMVRALEDILADISPEVDKVSISYLQVYVHRFSKGKDENEVLPVDVRDDNDSKSKLLIIDLAGSERIDKSGTARASLIVTVGPSVRYYSETSSTIMFGQRVR
ncbi:hypothetical protein HPP92_007515 [Vanilla planifolia]|uniref:Kinesin-like protein n=1 Tax=Vanilla planifolia TaxID=51239 RepID=A0A835RCT3_VANPL|nr:hypothetical protein HPP92_007515 [Vanilla planifolia]